MKSTNQHLLEIRDNIRANLHKPEADLFETFSQSFAVKGDLRPSVHARAAKLVNAIRNDDKPALLEVFLAEYGLSTDEGVALMCLAEALMRVPDPDTIDELIEDKIAPSSWHTHKGQSNSLLVNLSTWGLMLTGNVLSEGKKQGVTQVLKKMVKRLGEPVIRLAIKRAMKELGAQFVLGETISKAISRGEAQTRAGYTYSYDMLGEAALTQRDADRYFAEYENAIKTLATHANANDVADNPGISIKLSALHPRYEVGQRHRVMDELVKRVLSLTKLARQSNMGLNIDAEESERLDLSLDVIQAVVKEPELKGWDGFGVVVQAYGKSAPAVIDWLHELASLYDRKLMIRLVKGAYWDAEIKRAQELGLKEFPVYTRKTITDSAYLYCADKLLSMSDRIYPQFATHNANTAAAILELASPNAAFEFQRLHGMGEVLHRIVKQEEHVRCRIYAPVGPHKDLLAYLVRRLLENGANSSFVNQLVDDNVPAEELAKDVIEEAKQQIAGNESTIVKPEALYRNGRRNARGWDVTHHTDLAEISVARSEFEFRGWRATPLIAGNVSATRAIPVANPANSKDIVGALVMADKGDVQTAFENAKVWNGVSAKQRAKVLETAADLFEDNYGELFALLHREAGKTISDAIAELREAVDFLRYYALETNKLDAREARGVITCISPWNFPLAIFTGQVAAALAAGNAVLAKPAEQTSIIAYTAVKLLHAAGVPVTALQLLPGHGAEIGNLLVADERTSGVCFTGSTATAQRINQALSSHASPCAPLIAETGGLNAMIVDSTALPEQAVKDIVSSAFQSAGQRCSALRVLYLQTDIADQFLDMLYGAIDQQAMGNPWDYSTDIGPVINRHAKLKIEAHIGEAKRKGTLLYQKPGFVGGNFVPPTVIRISGIEALKEEIFGPVLHVVTFEAKDLDKVIENINDRGFGLTFGLHTRIDTRMQKICSQIKVGNVYVNRNQIGAIVGSQPFGGEGLSGTGPKAGGPHYVKRFTKPSTLADMRLSIKTGSDITEQADYQNVQDAISRQIKPVPIKLDSETQDGPTGESNILSRFARGVILCLGPTKEAAIEQAELVRKQGAQPLIICQGIEPEKGVTGVLSAEFLESLQGFDGIALWHDQAAQRECRKALSRRDGPILALFTDRHDMLERLHLERHVCINTTASGGDVALLASQ